MLKWIARLACLMGIMMTATRSDVLQSLRLQLQQISKGKTHTEDSVEVVSTGVSGLDGLLPQRGVPRGGMVEWLIADAGAGAATLALAGVRESLGGMAVDAMTSGASKMRSFEWTLNNANCSNDLSHKITTGLKFADDPRDRGDTGTVRGKKETGLTSGLTPTARQAGYWVVIDPLRQFFPPAALGWGVLPEQLLLIQPASERDAAWAFEQALRCPGVAVTWNWIGSVTERMLQRWKVAAEVGGGQGVLFRSDRALKQAAWADVRWLVQPLAGRGTTGRRFRLKLVYCRGALGGEQVEVECNDETGVVRVVPQLADSTSRVSAARA